MKTLPSDIITSIPKLPQSQVGLDDQLSDLLAVANRLGLYDAADFIKEALGK